MNILVKSALAGAALAFAFASACATPIEIGDDVQVVNPNLLGDAGPLGGAGAAGQDGTPRGGTGAGAGGATPAAAGMGGGGLSGMPVGSSGAGGLPVAGASGGGAGGAGGTAGGSGGAGGTAAGAGGAGGGAGSAGTGGTGSAAVFDASSCDFEDITGCDTLTCQAACPTNDGNSCLNRCVAVIECVTENVETAAEPCVTADDPLCGARDAGQARACTNVVEPAGGPDPNPPTGTQAPQPSFVARSFVECICSVPRP
jgi:hypothetical protein